MSILTLREDRARAHSAAISYLTKGKFDNEARSSFERAMAEVERLGREIFRLEQADRGVRPNFTKATPWSDPKEHRRAEIFERALRNRQTDDDKKWLKENRDVNEGDLISQIGAYSGLGFYVPAGFIYDIENATKYYAPLMDGNVVSVFNTVTGQPLPYPISNDTTVEAQIISESALVPEQDISAGSVIFGAWKYRSGVIRASLELIQDSAFDLSSWLADRFAIRFGRAYERDFTLGNGSGEPVGLLYAIAVGGQQPVVAQGSAETSGGSETGANSIGYSDLVNLEHSVDPSYRSRGRWMFHDSTLSQLKRILDKFGRPIWLPSLKEGAPDTILSYPYTINQHMPTIAQSHANQTSSLIKIQHASMLFGDFKKYMVRNVSGMAVQVLNERYADNGQVGYLAFSRADGALLDAGTHPIGALVQE